MRTHQHLLQYDISFNTARDFILNNLNNLQNIYETSLEFGVNNDMIAELLAENYPSLTGEEVALYFDNHGFDGNQLGFFNLADLTAYRAVYPDGNLYFSVDLTVSEADEENLVTGPGIRINSNSPLEDQYNDIKSNGEDDLIQIDINNITNGATLIRDDNNLKLYTDKEGDKEYVFENNRLILESSTDSMTLYAEYTGSIDATPILEIFTQYETPDDTLIFHPFDNMVVIISGETQEPVIIDETIPTIEQLESGNEIGVSSLAVELLHLGYDVHLLEEPDSEDFQGNSYWDLPFSNDGDLIEDVEVVLKEIEDGVLNRSIDKVALIGYSHGAGSIYELSELLQNSTLISPSDYNIFYSAYIDGVAQDGLFGITPENRVPLQSSFHENIYQTNGALHGASIEDANNNFDFSDSDNHLSIQINETALNIIFDGVNNFYDNDLIV